MVHANGEKFSELITGAQHDQIMNAIKEKRSIEEINQMKEKLFKYLRSTTNNAIT